MLIRLAGQAADLARWLFARDFLPEHGEPPTRSRSKAGTSGLRWVLAPEQLPVADVDRLSPEGGAVHPLWWLLSRDSLPDPEPVGANDRAQPSTLRWLLSRDSLPDPEPVGANDRARPSPLRWLFSPDVLDSPPNSRTQSAIEEE